MGDGRGQEPGIRCETGVRPRVLVVDGHSDAPDVVLDRSGLDRVEPAPGTAAGQLLTSRWLRDNLASFDTMHVFAGALDVDPWDVRAAVTLLRGHEVPLALTIEDLRRPTCLDNRLHDELLDVLAPAADHVLTWTRDAAGRIARRWGRSATVVPHPGAVDPELAAGFRSSRRRRGGRVGLHLGSLPANADHAPALLALYQLADAAPSVEVDVRVHNDAWDRNDRLRTHLRRLHRHPRFEIHVHDVVDEVVLHGWVGSLQVLLLADRFGTHSPWIPLCHRLGTRVVGPRLGGYVEQGLDVAVPVLPGDRLPAAAVLDALHAALALRTAADATASHADERDAVRAVHTRLHRNLCGLPAVDLPTVTVVPAAPSGTDPDGAGKDGAHLVVEG